jgi:hypothetical protein
VSEWMSEWVNERMSLSESVGEWEHWEEKGKIDLTKRKALQGWNYWTETHLRAVEGNNYGSFAESILVLTLTARCDDLSVKIWPTWKWSKNGQNLREQSYKTAFNLQIDEQERSARKQTSK